MRYRIIGALLLAGHFAFAQSLTIKEIKSDSGGHAFPVFESVDRPAVAKKINEIIQQEWDIHPGAKKPFGERSFEENEDFGYAVSANNDRVLCFYVESSYASCGLHITRSDYIFDTKTGASIDLNKLFGADGQSKLKRSLFKMWKAACRSAAADASNNRSDEYKECLAASESEKRTEVEISQMTVTDKGMVFRPGSCLEGTTFDFQQDVTAGPHVYSLGMLLPMLTPYGYSLFADQPANGPISALMRGMIDGKYPVSMTLLPPNGENAEGTIAGMIVYDRVGVPINISGKINGNQLMIHEVDDSNSALSNIEVSWDGSKLSGMFTNLKTKKQMSFVVSAVK